ncbi:MAG: LLM class flavin-dependent oxidoreductase [Hyphomicrobiales bacterium]|nr:LLM class flavin-dependent oxidoreductase [Hyphomicrobiales bacterium]
MQFGAYTFVETRRDPETGEPVDVDKAFANVLEQIELADQVGLDVFGVGEHHRPDYAASAPGVVLGAAAVRTKNIRLTSAVTVLSSDDPVRVFQEFSTIDLLSDGRAEVMAGRGSFIESFPLFGLDLGDYDALFSENLDLLLAVRDNEHVTWRGGHRPAIADRGVYPRPVQNPLPVWIAVGGTPASVVRAATLGLPLALAIIGGLPENFVPFVDLYRETGERLGVDPAKLKVGINSHAFVGATSQAAADAFYPSYSAVMTRIGKERGWPPTTRQQFDASRTRRGALLVGSADEVVEKILYEHSLFRHDRFLAQMDVGAVPHADVMKSIELLGTRVAPAVRKALG